MGIRQVFTAMALLLAVSAPAQAVDIEAFVKRDTFGDIKISPTGEYLAATVPLEDRTALAILRRSDQTVTGTVNLGRNRHVADFWWVNDGRVLLSGAEKIGEHDQPRLTGNLYGVDADGRGVELLVGQGLEVMSIGSNIQPKKMEAVAAFLVDPLRDSRDEVIISVSPFNNDPISRAERMNVRSGRRVQVARAPVRNGRFVTDQQGRVRAAHGFGTDNAWKLYLRDGEGGDWQLLNDEADSHRVDSPLGFSADGGTLYLQSSRDSGPDVVVALDLASGERRELMADGVVDPERVLFAHDTGALVGARFMDGIPRTQFIDPASDVARQYRGLEAAFKDQSVYVTSQTRDGRLTLVEVSSDRNPGTYYLFDAVDKTAQHVITRRAWLDPAGMAGMRPVRLAARDGTSLSGYVTLPPGTSGKGLPMVVMPHGGPYGVYDRWGFDNDAQLLAKAGYAVLQVNYRGSGNHGRRFQQAGAREWGGKMQDDVTDATRWAIAEGIADPARICIHGASYGGYAALMGAAKEPDLYRCASGYVGVYDLPDMQAGDARSSRRLGKWSKDWVGDDVNLLAAASPNRFAERIKVPVLLAAGGEDEIAPIGHTRKMERALKAAGVPVEALYYPTEGHGFYVEANRREYYTKLLAFLGQHLGGKTAASGG